MVNFRVFCLDVVDQRIVIYFNKIETVEFLALFDQDAFLKITKFYACGLHQSSVVYGISDTEQMKMVGDMRCFIMTRPDLQITELVGVIDDCIEFTLHDDFEINLILSNCKEERDIIKKIFKGMGYNDNLYNYLFKYKKKFIEIDDKTSIRKIYADFEEYVADELVES